MRHGYPPLGLSANDRLESSPQMADVLQFECLIEFPVIVLFWGSPEHPVVHRRHPLLSFEIGTSIDVFSVHVLHTLHLGVFQDWILRTLWLFYVFDFLDTGRKAKSQLLKETFSRIRRMLGDWYPNYEKKLGVNKVARVGSVFNNLIGSDCERVTAQSSWIRQSILAVRHGCVSPPQRSSAARAHGCTLETRCCCTWMC